MSTFHFPQENGQTLLIDWTVREGGGVGHMTIRPDNGTLFSKTLPDGRRIDALSLQWLGSFLALVEYQIDGRYASRLGQDLPYTRVDLDFSGKVLDVFEEDERAVFLEQIGNINACLRACTNFVKHHMIPGTPEPPTLV